MCTRLSTHNYRIIYSVDATLDASERPAVRLVDLEEAAAREGRLRLPIDADDDDDDDGPLRRVLRERDRAAGAGIRDAVERRFDDGARRVVVLRDERETLSLPPLWRALWLLRLSVL